MTACPQPSPDHLSEPCRPAPEPDPPTGPAMPLPSDESLPALWRRLFRPALIDWVHDFLFQTDSTTLASILAAPLQAAHALAMSVDAAQLGPTAGPPEQTSFAWVLLPAFSVAGVSVGLVVEGAPVHPGPWRLARYVRCDESGDTLCLGDAGDGTIEVDMLHHHSPSRSTRAYFQFTASARASLVSSRGGIIDACALRASLDQSMVLRETRACAVCAGPPGACDCTFQFALPAHPLDFRHTATNTRPMLGAFCGAGELATFRAGVRVSADAVATTVVARSGAPPGAPARMLAWAVQKCLATGSANPRALVVPGGAGGGGHPGDSADRMADLLLRPDDPGGGGELPAGLPVLPKRENVVPRVPTAAFLPFAPGGTRSLAPVGGTPAFPPTSTEIGMFPLEALTPSPGAQLAPALAPPLAPALGKRAWIAIAPAPSAAGAPDAGGVEYSSAERRKIMKREAAARSNAKRREVVALQKSIDRERARAEALTAREAELREENGRLRARLGGSL